MGDLALGDGLPSPTQRPLLTVLQSSLKGLSRLSSQCFDACPIESYWRSKSVNGYGEEIHCALPFNWANVEHSLPSREVAGVSDGAEVASGGIKDFLTDPLKYLKWEANRCWMKSQRVMVSPGDWEEIASGLLQRRICEAIPLIQVLHVDGQPVLGDLFGVSKGEEVNGIPVLRLILDLRPINQLFEAVAGDLHTLSMLSQLFPLEIFPGEDVLISSEDIKAMFYVIGVPDCWRPPGIREGASCQPHARRS